MQRDSSKSADFASLSPAVWRASTVVFPTLESFIARKERQPDGFSYGITGTPTSRNLEHRIAELEGARHCVIAPSGQAALMTAVMGFVRGGDHLLVSASCYGALKTFSSRWLSRMGVEVEFFDPSSGAELGQRFRSNTRMVCLESPGTVTMEMQDIPAIAKLARAAGILTMVDNTWASPLGFRPLDHGVDFSVEAATKFLGGHSDLLMGSISMNDPAHYDVLRETQSILGQQVSPDDCFLVLRALDTLQLRVERQSESAYRIAKELAADPLVSRVLYPALESDPGHARWRDAYKLKGSLFSLILKEASEAADHAFFNALKRFVIGASWGGVHSLAAYYPAPLQAQREFPATDRAVIRLSIGLEDPELLLGDIQSALQAYGHAIQPRGPSNA